MNNVKVAVTTKIRSECIKHRDGGQLTCAQKFPLILKKTVHKNHEKPAILYGREVKC